MTGLEKSEQGFPFSKMGSETRLETISERRRRNESRGVRVQQAACVSFESC